jgi:hypothetical protein
MLIAPFMSRYYIVFITQVYHRLCVEKAFDEADYSCMFADMVYVILLSLAIIIECRVLMKEMLTYCGDITDCWHIFENDEILTAKFSLKQQQHAVIKLQKVCKMMLNKAST